jgi:hypothetical protein
VKNLSAMTFFVFILVLCGCGGDPSPRVSSPVEGGNPVLAARVVDSLGFPVQGARVRLWSQPPLDSLLDSFALLGEGATDANGRVAFPRPAGKRFILEANDLARRGCALSGQELTSDTALLAIARFASVGGVWKGTGPRPAWIGLSDLPLRAALGADGSFTLEEVPYGSRVLREGPYAADPLHGRRRVLATFRVAPGQTLKLDTLVATDSVFLVDDFETGGTTTALGLRVPDGKWSVSPPGGDSTRMEPGSAGLKAIDQSRMNGGDQRGNAWKIRVMNLPGDTLRRGTVALGFAASGVDARGLDSILFRARGGARIRLTLVGAAGAMSRELTLPTIWGEVSLATGDMSTKPSGTLVSAILSTATRLEIMELDTGNVEFWLDNLRLRGWPK